MQNQIQCCTPGCRGPAWLESSVGYDLNWWCHCDRCSLVTIAISDREKAIERWYGEQFELDMLVVNGEKPLMRILDIYPDLPAHHDLYGRDCYRITWDNFSTRGWNRMYAEWREDAPGEFFYTFPQETVYLWLEQAL